MREAPRIRSPGVKDALTSLCNFTMVADPLGPMIILGPRDLLPNKRRRGNEGSPVNEISAYGSVPDAVMATRQYLRLLHSRTD